MFNDSVLPAAATQTIIEAMVARVDVEMPTGEAADSSGRHSEPAAAAEAVVPISGNTALMQSNMYLHRYVVAGVWQAITELQTESAIGKVAERHSS